MRRRQVLHGAGAILSASVAGCVGITGERVSNGVGTAPTASFSMESVTDAELPGKVLYTVHDGDEKAQIVERAVDGGTTARSIREPPLPEQRHLLHQTRKEVYELNHEVSDETPATTYSVLVDILETTPDASEVVKFSELPAVDREQFKAAGLADGDPVGIGTTFTYTDAEREQSRLVPDSDVSAIEWADGTRAEWVVDDAYDQTLTTYRYTGEQIAAAAEYGKRMRNQFAFELGGLSTEQQDIVQTAIEENGYFVDPDETPSEPFRSLADQFRDERQARGLDEGPDDKLSGTYLVRYREEVYWTDFMLQSTTETPA